MKIKNAMATAGFMAEVELVYIAHLATKALHVAEIGSWQGRSARAWAENTEGFVVCVDTWADDAYSNAPAEMTGRPEWLRDAFKENTRGLDNIVPWRMTSVEGAEKARRLGVTFDVIFIDAGHNYEDVVADIVAWRPLLRDGGILCGHDMYPDGPFHPAYFRQSRNSFPSIR